MRKVWRQTTLDFMALWSAQCRHRERERDDPETWDWVLSLEDEPDGEQEEGRVVDGSPLLRENIKGIRIA